MARHQMNVRLEDEVYQRLLSQAYEGESPSACARRLLGELLGVQPALGVPVRTGLYERLEAIEERLSKLEASQGVQECTHNVQPVKLEPSAQPSSKLKRRSQAKPLPSEAEGLYHPKECSELVGVQYPSGWDGLVRRQGTEFVRDGYRFKRTEHRKVKAYLWDVQPAE